MSTVEAAPYFFPGWDAGTVATTSLTFGTGPETICLSLPVLTPEALDAMSQHLLAAQAQHLACRPIAEIVEVIDRVIQDRKSTRLNSSHLGISYAVFCLKKKIKKY